MAAFTRVEEVTIPRTPEEGQQWGWEPHESVTLKGTFTVGDAEASSIIKMTPNEQGKPEVTTSTSLTKQMYRMIKRWTLTDEQHRVAEVTLRNIEMLPVHYLTPIMDAIEEITKRGQVVDPLALSSTANEPTFQI